MLKVDRKAAFSMCLKSNCIPVKSEEPYMMPEDIIVCDFYSVRYAYCLTSGYCILRCQAVIRNFKHKHPTQNLDVRHLRDANSGADVCKGWDW